jgi:hypothetical protein
VNDPDALLAEEQARAMTNAQVEIDIWLDDELDDTEEWEPFDD